MKKSEVKLADFGLPNKKKYPMPDEKHVKSAIKFFNYVSSEDEEELAANIKKKMRQYNISPDSIGNDNRLKRYVTEAFVAPKNINTIIFDFGGVLINNEGIEKHLEEAGIPQQYIQELIHCMYNDIWCNNTEIDQLDKDQLIAYIKNALKPELKKYAVTVWYCFQDASRQFPYTKELLATLKSNGYKLYYLSNWDRGGHDECVRRGLFDFLDMFDGGIFSYQVGLMKPDMRIYELLIKRYQIDPQTSIFFDDREENVEAANKLGISGIVFTPDIGYDLLKSQKEKMQTVKESAVMTEGYVESTDDAKYIKQYEHAGIVQSILEEPMIASSKVFIVNNMMNNTFIGVGYGDDTSIQRLKVDPNIDISNKDINHLIDQGIASVYEYIGPDAYAEMCITESADTASVSRDYFRRTYIEVCSKVDAICEVTEATLWGNINTKINPTALSLLGEVTLCPKGALKLPKEFECTSVLETHQDIDGYYLKNPLTEKRSKSRRLGSAVPYYTVKHLLEYKL